MAYQQTDLDGLQAALVSGAKYVRIGDRLIEYRTQAELIEAIVLVSRALAAPAPLTSSPNLVQAAFSKGRQTNGSSSTEGGAW